MKRRTASAMVLALALTVGALFAPPYAAAHAVLVGANPGDGTRLGSSPHRIRLAFSEDISPRFRSARLVAADGRVVAQTRLRQSGSSRMLVLETPKLRKGTYALVWRVLAEEDGHSTSGTVAFGVRTSVSGVAHAPREPLPAPEDAAIRWLRFSLLALVIGCLAFTLTVLDRVNIERELLLKARQAALDTAAIGAGLALLAQLADLARQVHIVGPSLESSWSGLLAALLLYSRWGHLWAIESAALLGLAVVSLRLWRGKRRPDTICSAALAAIVVACEGLGGHAAALNRPLVAIAADALHIAAAAAWLGGLAAFAIALLAAARMGERRWRVLALACRRPFATLASSSVGLLVVTGLYSAGRQVASVDALLTSFYGRTLLVKSALVVGICALGATNARLLRRLAAGRTVSVRKTVAAELVVGGLVLLAAGVLTASTPARGPQYAAPRPVQPGTATRQVEDLVLAVSVRPNRQGTNLVTVQTASSRRPPPAPISSVSVKLESGELRLRPIQPNRFVGFAFLSSPGLAEMTVAVNRGRRVLASRVNWSVERSDPARALVLSRRSIASIADPAALAIVALVILGLVFPLRRRPQPVRLPRVRQEPS